MNLGVRRGEGGSYKCYLASLQRCVLYDLWRVIRLMARRDKTMIIMNPARGEKYPAFVPRRANKHD